jgi:hypothetical protein
MLVSSRRAADGSEMREWQKQRTERQARLAAGSSYHNRNEASKRNIRVQFAGVGHAVGDVVRMRDAIFALVADVAGLPHSLSI